MYYKINKKLGLLRRIKPCQPLSQDYIFNSFILPLFDYGGIIWGDRGNTKSTGDQSIRVGIERNIRVCISRVELKLS